MLRSCAIRKFGEQEVLIREIRPADPPRHAEAVTVLVDFLAAERKRVPADVLRDARRVACLVFCGYDPDFQGDEPPGPNYN